MNDLTKLLAGVIAFSVSVIVSAQDVTHYEEPGLTSGRDYAKHHFAERIDPFTGNLSLQYVDLLIPGNGGFDLRIQRSYNSNAIGESLSPFGRGWQIHFGRVRHVTGQACSGATAQTMVLELPDGGRQTFHKSSGVAGTSASDYLTTSFWKGQCVSDGMNVFSPDGTKYEMTEADGPYWHVKKITDRFGNYFNVTYVLNTATGRKVVSQIAANDGRQATFSYSAQRLTSIQGGGVNWGYTVASTADGNQLTQVARPAGGNWSYQYHGELGANAGSYALRRVTNPFNGVVAYEYGFVNFMPGVVGGPPPITAVTETVAGGDTWRYSYSPSCSGSGDDTTTVTLPGGIGQIVYKHFGYCSVNMGEIWKIGLLKEKRLGNHQTETYSWAPHTISNEATWRPGYFTFDPQIHRPLLATRSIARDGVTFSTTHSSFDAFGNPTSIAESGSSGNRNRTLTYFNHLANWIVGLVDDESISGVGSIARSRNSATGALTSESLFGVQTTYSYFTDGAVSSKTTDKPATTSYSSYAKGIPQSENRPAGVTINRSVDGLGNVTSETDGEYTWGYGYDGIGRLTSINFPGGSDATINWSTTSKTLTRGSFSETTQLDAFGRTTSVSRQGVVTNFNHDALGRKTFQSLPGSGSGTSYSYDILGRVTLEQSPAGQKTYSYSGGDVSVVNERNNTTRYEFDRYGDPDEGYLVGIAAPEASASISMSRNRVGVLLSATQGGITRTYGRNTRFFLTSINEPEANTTFGRDGVGNMTSKTSGGLTVSYGYDGLNRMTSISGTGVATTIGYNARSKVTSVSNGAAVRSYAYDSNGNLTRGTLAVDGQTFVVNYGYDTLDGLISITYPMSKGAVTYAPDALGRPTRASPFATSVAHHNSGNLSSITYGNGITQSFGENSRQLPSTITAGAIQLGLTYGYDGVGNVTSVSDSYSGSQSRTLGYDAVDRLTTASGPWGTGSIAYSGAGNITRQTFGPYTINYTYSSNRVATIYGSVARTFSYDSAGNMTNGGNREFDRLSQLTCANCGTPSESNYQYDGQGRRVIEDAVGKRTYFVQAPNGDLQFEYSPYGKRWAKHIYLHGKRIATENGSDALSTSTALTSSPSSPTYGQAVTLTATLSPGAATGSVEFIDGDRSLGTANIVSGKSTLTVSDLEVGTRTIVANYPGDANYQASSASKAVTVGKRASTTALATSPGTVALGASVTLSATVTGSSPTGSVEFRDGGAVVGFATLNTSGVATLNYQPTSVGVHELTVRYMGDALHLESTSPAVGVTVGKGNPTVVLTLSSPSRPYGMPVTFQVSLSGIASLVPTGMVTFMDGNTALASVSVSGGVASFTTNYLAPGQHPITAIYAGDASYNSGTSPVQTQLIAGAPPVVRSVPPQLLGEPEE